MKQPIDTKVIIGVVTALLLVIGVLVYRSLTTPATAATAGGHQKTVTPPTLPTAEDRRKMQEARSGR